MKKQEVGDEKGEVRKTSGSGGRKGKKLNEKKKK